MTNDQLTAFAINAGFTPEELNFLLLGFVFAILLLWGAWAIKSAYVCWASQKMSDKEFALVVIRFFALYILISFLLLS
ncbi:TIGR03758 family integrating conjugative element protein [Zophobihabitans entericus]|uniref:TIGR03758 family integrating conjugative element protein n=1 Tax=Zophobihabitans entericus TaxID=1635327 RepID=A0A6G9IB59_9GAMM|nr:TIGR03758 family integrating conjugative element protein [Zophobihabitans entericus]QIQ21466.1 TIGR03758 family integrating conjugative element protein [Zophobihabitans entericus]